MNSFDQSYEVFCKTINDYDLVPEDRENIFIFYSGGKDASLLVDLFLKYKNEVRRDLNISLLTISFPEMIYNSKDPLQRDSVANAIQYWQQKGCTHKMINLPPGIGDHLFNDRPVPCEVCESTKAKIIFDELSKEEYRNALVGIAHTIEDTGGYFSEILYLSGQYHNWMEIRDSNSELFNRIMDLGKRVYPKYIPPAFKTNLIYIKPLIEMEEDLIRNVKQERKYPDIPECCAKIRGDKFRMYKRIVMQGFDWLRDRYKNKPAIYDNMMFKNYRNMLKKYQDIKLIPPIEEIEKLNLKSGI